MGPRLSSQETAPCRCVMSMQWQNVNPCRRTRPCFPPVPSPVPCLPRESSGPSRLFLEDASSASCHGPSPSRHHLEHPQLLGHLREQPGSHLAHLVPPQPAPLCPANNQNSTSTQQTNMMKQASANTESITAKDKWVKPPLPLQHAASPETWASRDEARLPDKPRLLGTVPPPGPASSGRVMEPPGGDRVPPGLGSRRRSVHGSHPCGLVWLGLAAFGGPGLLGC